MDHTDLTEEFLLNKVATPVVLGLFANDEWDSIAMNPDPAGEGKWLVRVIADWEVADIPLDFSEGVDSVADLQLTLIAGLRAFIDGSDFAQRRDEDWEADEHNIPRPSLWRAPRPDFEGPDECLMRLRRIGSRNLRLHRRRCASAHRRD